MNHRILAPGLVGFGAFYIPESQDVQIRTLNRINYGPTVGAGNLQLTLLDAARRVIRVVE